MKKIGWKYGKKGQTIIEVLIAAAVISIALTAMVAVVTSALARNREAKERITAARMAQEVAENFRTARDVNGWGAFIVPSLALAGGNSGSYVACIGNSFTYNSASSLFNPSNISFGDTEAKLNDAVSPITSCPDKVTANNVEYRRAVLVDFSDSASPAYFRYKIAVDWSQTGGKPAHIDVAGVLYEY